MVYTVLLECMLVERGVKCLVIVALIFGTKAMHGNIMHEDPLNLIIFQLVAQLDTTPDHNHAL